MSFANQTTWITGASSGIGAALARAFAAQGARLVLSGRNEAALGEVAAACKAAGGVETLVLPFETTDYAALPALADAAWNRSGGIDVLINNAGISQRALAVDSSFAVYQRIVDVDLLAPIALTQAILPRMAAQGSGRLAFVSSVAGKVGVPLRTAYCAAKHGLIGYADALRAEIAHLGLAVHVLVPGSIRTNVSRNALAADGSVRGVSDRAIENGIDPDVAAAQMLSAMLAGEREIVIAEGIEQQLGEMRRTPDALFDRVAALMARGYADQYKAGTDPEAA